MAECQFNETITGDPQAMFQNISAAITNAGGSINGDANAGAFSIPVPVLGGIDGTYTIAGQLFQIAIGTKPLLITCGEIGSFIDNFIRNNAP